MQTKSYQNQERQTLAANTQLNLTIENTENRKENFHGIRAKGRINSDDTAVGFSSGFIVVMCLPTSASPTPVFASDTVMDDNNEFIIAVEPFQVHNSTAAGNVNDDFGSCYDFDIVLGKTSRTCSRGGQIVLQIHNDAGSVNSIIVTTLLSLFRTIA